MKPLILSLALLASASAQAPAPPTAQAQAPAAQTPAAQTPAAQAPAAQAPVALPTLSWQPYVSGLRQVTTVTEDGTRPVLYVTQQDGQVRMVAQREGSGELLPGLFLDLRSVTRAQGERGLLGLAFDPRYAQNRFVYVHYTDLQGNTVLARYRAAPDFRQAEAGSAQVLFRAPQPYANHNGGQLAFGPDGMLYVGLGDGGSGGDPQNLAQNLSSPLGKILRLDVQAPAPHVPRDNPFLGRQGAHPLVWAYGLRNPWRFSFDRDTGALVIADVGQTAREEVNLQPASSRGGENYGWRLKEGELCFNPRQGCAREGLVDPVLTYGRSEGQSITGGYVYRGAAIPALRGHYVFGDFGTGNIWASRVVAGPWQKTLIGRAQNPSAFGQDRAGELYVAEYSSGRILRLSTER